METRQLEIRAAEKPLTLTGTAVVFNRPADLGGMTEVIAPDALRGLSLDDIVLITNHDGGQIPLARSPKTLALTVTEQGLEMTAKLPDTEQARAVYEAVKRGDLSQMSFAFDIGECAFDEATQTRTITQISKIYEISIVNYAAYKQTNVQARAGKEENTMSNFNPITAGLEKGNATTDTHAAPEYRSAFFKHLLGKDLTDGEARAFAAAQAERRADSFNTLSNSAAVIPTTTLNEVVKQARGVNGLFNEVRLFSVPNNLSVPVGTPTDAAAWHTEGEAVERTNVTTAAVTFTGRELIKVLSMSAAVKRMDTAAFERYLTDELKSCIADAIGAAIVSGTGSGQPQGILSGVTWGADNSITDEITADNLLAQIALMPAGYTGGAKFAMSAATLFGSVYPLKDGDGRYFFTDPESGGVRRLFGFEIVLDDNIPAGTVLFGNFRYYGVNIPQGVAIEVSRESGFTSGLIDYRALCIADGKPIVPGAFVKLSAA